MRISFLLLFVAVICIQCNQDGTSKAPESSNAEAAQNQTYVEVVRPEARSFDADVSITGTAKADKQVIIYSMISGFVKSINFDLGDEVKKGQKIAELSNPAIYQKYQIAQSNIEVTKSEHRRAKSMQLKTEALAKAKQANYNRLKSIYEKTPALTTIADLEEAQSEAEAHSAEIGTAKAQVEVMANRSTAAEAVLENIKIQLGMLSIKAPFSGIVSKRFVDPGASIQSGLDNTAAQPIVELQDIETIRVEVSLPEQDASNLSKGSSVSVLFPSLAISPFEGKVSRTSGVLDPMSKTMTIQIDLKNKERIIKPGMYAKIDMNLGSRDDVLSLPNEAQYIYQDEPYVWLVNKDEQVEKVALRKGLIGLNHFEVLNDDVNKSSRIVVKGKNLIKEGQQVVVK